MGVAGNKTKGEYRMHRHAVVAGATGLVGHALVRRLLDEPAYGTVTLLVRRSAEIEHPKLRERKVDFDALEQAGIEFGGADVFCALGTTIKKAGSQEAFRRVDYAYPLSLARSAKSQGARQLLIVTSLGANSSSRAFYTRVKGELEEALRALGLPALHLFRPSLLLGERAEFRLGERLMSAALEPLSPLFSIGSLRKYRPVRAESVARAMVRAALRDESGVRVHENDSIPNEAE